MIATRTLSQEQLRNVFGRISRGLGTFGEAEFNKEFSNVEFLGKQLITTPRPALGASTKGRKTAGRRGKSQGHKDAFETVQHR